MLKKIDFQKNFECAQPFCRNTNFSENKWRPAAASSWSCEAGADCPLVSFFKLSADAFLDQITVVFSESKLKKNAEIDTYKFFCDVIEAVDVGGTVLFPVFITN